MSVRKPIYGESHFDHWHELPGFPTQEEFDRLKHDQTALKRLERDLLARMADSTYTPEPWWKEAKT